jgi:succinate dehydrogenase / fumarate reductase membrane anchor subunit
MPTKNYINQRLSAILLVPLTLWFAWIVCKILHFGQGYFTNFMHSAPNIIALTLFVLIALYHAIFGLDSIISDYITSKTSRYFIWVTLFALYAVTVCAFIFAMFHLNSLL